MYFTRQCRTQRRALTLHSPTCRLCYVYNAMGVHGQHPDVASIVIYFEGMSPLLFGALMAALRRGRPDVGIAAGMARVVDLKPESLRDELLLEYVKWAVQFGVPEAALPGLTSRPGPIETVESLAKAPRLA